MKNFILAMGALTSLLAAPFSFLVGLGLVSQNPLVGLGVILLGTPTFAALAIVFEYVRTMLEIAVEDPAIVKRPQPQANPNDKKPEYRASDLAGTPWAKPTDRPRKK